VPSDEDVDARDGRDESDNERSDRNWNELLQETRIVQTGTQILSGFLLTIAFQPRFATLSSFQHDVYLTLVLLSTLTTALALSPVVLHRRLFRKHEKHQVVQIGHRLLLSALLGLGLVMTGTVLLIFDVAEGLRGGTAAAAGVVVVLVVLTLVPTHQARRARRS
jgi:Family of unknown function (DUF6328)